MRHFRSIHDLTIDEFHHVVNLARRLKTALTQGIRPAWLAQRSLALLFDKPSLRTRLSFEAGVIQLGGTPIYLGQDVGWRTRESVSDFVRVLGQYCDFLVCRTFAHETIHELASHDAIVVINGLTDNEHPCQAMADTMTMIELAGDLKGKTIVFVGDGNNVARSLMHVAAYSGMKFRLLGPLNHHVSDDWIAQLKSRHPKVDIEQTSDPRTALANADFIYTDVWVSMGQEKEAESRRASFSPFQINAQLLQHAPSHAKVLHCLPAKRGQEITDEVMDGKRSHVILQAANRMHLQKGLLVWLAIQNKMLDERMVNDFLAEGIA